MIAKLTRGDFDRSPSPLPQDAAREGADEWLWAMVEGHNEIPFAQGFHRALALRR